MSAPEVSKTLKQIDPIWKRLRFDRGWKVVYLISVLFYLYYFVVVEQNWKNGGSSIYFSYIFWVLIIIGSISSQFMNERYWKRIGKRRVEALPEVQPFRGSNQPPHDESIQALPITL